MGVATGARNKRGHGVSRGEVVREGATHRELPPLGARPVGCDERGQVVRHRHDDIWRIWERQLAATAVGDDRRTLEQARVLRQLDRISLQWPGRNKAVGAE